MYLLTPKKYINSVQIIAFNGLEFSNKNLQFNLSQKTLKESLEACGAPIWIRQKLKTYDGQEMMVISLVRLINDINNITKKLGILIINIPEKAINKIYNEPDLNNQASIYLLNQQQRIISTNRRTQLGKKITPQLIKAAFLKQNYGYYSLNYQAQGYLASFYKLKEINYKLLSILPTENLLAKNIAIKNIVILSIIIGLICSFIAIFLFNQHLLKPLNQIKNVMEELKNENFSIRLNIKGNNEIAILGKTFNKMSARLKKLMEEIYLSKLKQKESELKALQAQVNPHFLYNTLDTIYWSSRLEKAYKTANLIKALGKLFRLSLNQGDEITTLAKELTHLENYLTIQKARYESSLDVVIEKEERLLQAKVVKLILQPLVENSICYGAKANSNSVTVIIKIYAQEKNLIYEVIDNGPGADIQKLNYLINNKNEKKGFALQNVQARIKLYFGDEYGIEFANSQQGFKVMVKQKLKLEEKDDKNDDC